MVLDFLYRLDCSICFVLVYCNGVTDCDKFDNKLDFEISLIPYVGDDSWVEETIVAAHECLNSDELPNCTADCDFCNYVEAVTDAEEQLEAKNNGVTLVDLPRH